MTPDAAPAPKPPLSAPAVPATLAAAAKAVLTLSEDVVTSAGAELARLRPPVNAVLPVTTAIDLVDALPAEVRKEIGFEKLMRIVAAWEVAENAKRADPVAERTKALVAGVNKLYDASKYLDGIEFADKILAEHAAELSKSQKQAIYAVKAWCHYRRSEWADVMENIELADGSQAALECELYVRSYVADYKDAERIAVIEAAVGTTINATNAYIIRSRTLDAPDYVRVEEFAARFTVGSAQEPVLYANLMHNTGRVFLDKSRDRDDLRKAQEYLERAISCYGVAGNFHHRGAAYFWLSKVHELRGNLHAALDSVTQSEWCWRRQMGESTVNKDHFTKLMSAVHRLDHLCKVLAVPAAERRLKQAA